MAARGSGGCGEEGGKEVGDASPEHGEAAERGGRRRVLGIMELGREFYLDLILRRETERKNGWIFAISPS